jgi:hypothetical protein
MAFQAGYGAADVLGTEQMISMGTDLGIGVQRYLWYCG